MKQLCPRRTVQWRVFGRRASVRRRLTPRRRAGRGHVIGCGFGVGAKDRTLIRSRLVIDGGALGRAITLHDPQRERADGPQRSRDDARSTVTRVVHELSVAHRVQARSAHQENQ